MVTLKTSVLKEEVAKRNLTHAELARMVNTNPAYLSRVVNGHSEPGPDFRRRLLDALGLSFDALFEFHQPKSRKRELVKP